MIVTVGTKTANVSHSVHIGCGKLQYDTILNVIEVQADCDELEMIRSEFPMLCPSSLRVVRWFGDTAKLVVQAIR